MHLQTDKESRVNISEYLRSIAYDKIEEISHYASQASQQMEESTHIIRKRLKFLRALLKLTRHCSDSDAYKNLNITLRDHGREISACRDYHVKGILLQEIGQNRLFGSVQPVVEELTHINQKGTEQEERKLLSGAPNSYERISSQLLNNGDFENYFLNPLIDTESVLEGFSIAYLKSSNAFHEGYISHNAKSLHEWRKRTKDIQYQLEILNDSLPDSFYPAYTDLAELCEVLGRINDLYMFLSWIQGIVQTLEYNEHIPALSSGIKQEINKLKRKAEVNGNSLYQYTPEEYRKNVEIVFA